MEAELASGAVMPKAVTALRVWVTADLPWLLSTANRMRNMRVKGSQESPRHILERLAGLLGDARNPVRSCWLVSLSMPAEICRASSQGREVWPDSGFQVIWDERLPQRASAARC